MIQPILPARLKATALNYTASTAEPMLNREQLARLLGVNPLAVREWREKGKLTIQFEDSVTGRGLIAWSDLARVLANAIREGSYERLRTATKPGPPRGRPKKVAVCT